MRPYVRSRNQVWRSPPLYNGLAVVLLPLAELSRASPARFIFVFWNSPEIYVVTVLHFAERLHGMLVGLAVVRLHP